jgi:hypothetical protein
VIKTWNERCQEHPDHQTGMVSNTMIQARMEEEIDELRAALAQPERKPLTKRQILEELGLGSIDVEFVRMVERAHGIGDLSNLFEADKADSEGGEV